MANKIIGIYIAHFHDDIHANILKHVYTKARNSGFLVEIYATYDDIFSSDLSDCGAVKMYESMDMSRYCALILFSETIKFDSMIEEVVSMAHRSNVPVISLEKKVDGCYNVLFEHGAAFEEIVRHVVEGHEAKKVNMIAGMRNNEYSEERINVYKKVLLENGIEIDENRIGYGDFWKAPAIEALKKFLEYDVPDAIICANDAMAVPVCEYLANEGYRVPEDIIVTGYDGLELALYAIPSITTAGPLYKDLAEAAVEIVTSIVLNNCPPVEEAEVVYVPHVMITSQSCGCKKPTLNYYGKRVASLNTRIDEMLAHSHNMFRMVNKACTKGFTVEQIMSTLPPKMYPPIKCDFLYLCAYDNYMDLGLNNPGDGTDCTIVFQVVKGDYSWPMKRIKSAEVLPNYDKLLTKECAILKLPIHYNEDVLGYMCIGHDPNEIDYVQLRSFGLNINNIFGNTNTQMELRTMNEKLEHMYNRDALTNLFNRRGFYEELNRYKLTGKRQNYLVASIDLNGLKYINDNFGHAEGDYAITQIAKLIDDFDKAERIVARIGGDEYVMFVASDLDKEELEKQVDEYLTAGMEEINKKSDKRYEITGSYGLAVDAIKNIDRFEEVLKLADDIMYVHKRKRYLR